MCAAAWILLIGNRAAAFLPDVASHGYPFEWPAMVIVSVVLQLAAVLCAVVALVASRSTATAALALVVSMVGCVVLWFYLVTVLKIGP